MSRSQIRQQIFLLLFSTEFFTREELETQLPLNMQSHEAIDGEAADASVEIAERDAVYIEEKVRAIYALLDEIDAQINACAEGWKTSRMGKAELAIIRLAVYEMKYEEEIPVAVAINEAVELAKVYGDEHGAAFVNGVLAKLA